MSFRILPRAESIRPALNRAALRKGAPLTTSCYGGVWCKAALQHITKHICDRVNGVARLEDIMLMPLSQTPKHGGPGSEEHKHLLVMEGGGKQMPWSTGVATLYSAASRNMAVKWQGGSHVRTAESVPT